MADILNQDIKFLKGVGPNRAKTLGDELKVFTVRDLLYTFPFKYIDRSVIYTIRELREDMSYVQIVGKITDLETEGEGRKHRLKAIFTDGTGFVEIVWFNAFKYIEKNLRFDQKYLLFGKPSSFNGRISFAHPELEVYPPKDSEGTPSNGAAEELGAQTENNVPTLFRNEEAAMARRQTLVSPWALQPHYHTTEKMKRFSFNSRQVSELVRNALKAVGNNMPETLPDYLIKKYHLAPLLASVQTLHFPQSSEELPAARRRLKFDELFYLQLDILRYTKNRKLNYAGFVFSHVGEMFHTFYEKYLPFPLTGAQKRVVKEIRRDLGVGRQMNRLLQGDVGSGKTMVALLAALIAIDNGFQVCLMAPTEILAEQHLETLKGFLQDMPVGVSLLTGNVKGAARKRVLADVANGDVHILVGTHALIEPKVVFHNLGLAIIDEQHRFGVKQRAKLWDKNVRPPHILVMTATPIPRTLAMTVYGDLDVSVIDELPPGRKPVQTLHYTSYDLPNLFEGMRRQLLEGRQVYVVFPLIEESEKSDLKDLENGYLQLCEAFPGYAVGKVHGRMKPAEKEAAMQAFMARETQILVSTTVIEVGVNVPNATVMVVWNADRFGLSQLHQLRGRVGRGADRSYCILVTSHKLSDTTRRRIGIMTETTDGFRIAEEDLRLRGPGDLQGTEQSGLPFELKVADLVRDSEMMAVCREAAANVIEGDPYENLSQNQLIWRHLRLLTADRKDFSNIS